MQVTYPVVEELEEGPIFSAVTTHSGADDAAHVVSSSSSVTLMSRMDAVLSGHVCGCRFCNSMVRMTSPSGSQPQVFSSFCWLAHCPSAPQQVHPWTRTTAKELVGLTVGLADGLEDGLAEGRADGRVVGLEDGMEDGLAKGLVVGLSVGLEGLALGLVVGAEVGAGEASDCGTHVTIS